MPPFLLILACVAIGIMLPSGGVRNSFHIVGRAADIICYSSKHRWMLVDAAMKAGMNGIGIDRYFIHVDNRNGEQLIFLY